MRYRAKYALINMQKYRYFDNGSVFNAFKYDAVIVSHTRLTCKPEA